jgi:hypothetical protein
MKNIIGLIGISSLVIFESYSQVAPTYTSLGGQTNTDFWSRAENSTSGNNIFGTKWNSPIYTVTGNVGPLSKVYKPR